MRDRRASVRAIVAALAIAVVALGGVCVALRAQTPPQALPQNPPLTDRQTSPESSSLADIDYAMVRLPLAAVLGAALALRPKRRGTPKRTPAVVQTQIILSVVGAVIMLVVGASLARAFGIVGAANLIRYRSKIDDPKDAGVMLCALAVGLASGVGLYALAVFSTAFLVAALSVIESFEPTGKKRFSLSVKAAKETDQLRPAIEKILQRHHVEFDLRTSSDAELAYDVQLPIDGDTERVTDRLLALDPQGHLGVEWSEKKAKNDKK